MKRRYLIIFLFFTLSLSGQSDKSEQIFLKKKIHQLDQNHVVESGYLYISAAQDIEVPDVFSYIAQENRSFQFIQRSKAFGAEGYAVAPRITIQESKQAISSSQLKAEYYMSKVRLQNTPNNWLFGVCSKGSYFFSPRGLFRMVKKERPLTIKRYTLED